MSERLLKARELQRAGPQVAFNFTDLRRQCDEYLAEVTKQAEALIAEARTQGETLRQESYAEGFDLGRREGLSDAERLIRERSQELADRQTRERLESVVPALETAVTSLQAERDQWFRAWESGAVRLCAAIAERIVQAELSRRPELVAGPIAEALQLVAGEPRFTLRLHPDDLSQLEACGNSLVARLSALGQATLSPDPQLTRGGCIVETAHGVVDARLESQIERIIEELTAE